jgi:cytochrome c-type biogenesis protein CcmE
MPGGPPGTASDPTSTPDELPGAAVDAALLEHRPRRAPLLLLGLVALVAAGWLAVDAFQGSVVYYLTPTEALAAGDGEVFRLAGLVVDGSVAREAATGTLRFEVTDGTTTVPVRFDGRAPDGLGDGAEAVAEGRFGPDGVFEAETVLARCASKFEAELEAP